MKLGSILILTATLTTASLVPQAGQAKSAYQIMTTSAMTMAGQSSRQAKSQLRVKSKDQAIQLVKRQYRGKVLKAQSSRVNGNPGYRIKMLSNQGVVFYVSVDAKTGSVRRN
ncbi:PepSY domain-containing protein [Shewanella nanhaiensis]|uniref:PepSY domain-containing protein n=1 Tax=Shewanella nanhaiensis TaxID=2864872 RepID=A0ABS7E7B8_9GAMM|nr:PepSY domain-containing protein [Shewanella nanhaiensis]MBW8185571.1 PepSY domain-containing protein [Shewanella nanhaiensis]